MHLSGVLIVVVLHRIADRLGDLFGDRDARPGENRGEEMTRRIR